MQESILQPPVNWFPSKCVDGQLEASSRKEQQVLEAQPPEEAAQSTAVPCAG